MHRWVTISSGIMTVALLSAGLAFGQQSKATDCDRARVPEKVEGEVVRVDPRTNIVTIRGAQGTTYEFKANEATVKDMKPGDRIEAQLRQAPKC